MKNEEWRMKNEEWRMKNEEWRGEKKKRMRKSYGWRGNVCDGFESFDKVASGHLNRYEILVALCECEEDHQLIDEAIVKKFLFNKVQHSFASLSSKSRLWSENQIDGRQKNERISKIKTGSKEEKKKRETLTVSSRNWLSSTIWSLEQERASINNSITHINKKCFSGLFFFFR